VAGPWLREEIDTAAERAWREGFWRGVILGQVVVILAALAAMAATHYFSQGGGRVPLDGVKASTGPVEPGGWAPVGSNPTPARFDAAPRSSGAAGETGALGVNRNETATQAGSASSFQIAAGGAR
jgi:hypothetical protein